MGNRNCSHKRIEHFNLGDTKNEHRRTKKELQHTQIRLNIACNALDTMVYILAQVSPSYIYDQLSKVSSQWDKMDEKYPITLFKDILQKTPESEK